MPSQKYHFLFNNVDQTPPRNGRDCAIDLLAHAEALLSSSELVDRYPDRLLSPTELASKTPAEMRLHYLQLLMPLDANDVRENTCQAMFEREAPVSVHNRLIPKEPRIFDTCEQPILVDNPLHGTADLDHILKLVYAVGCPQVLSDLLTAIQVLREHDSGSKVRMAVFTHVKAEASDARNVLCKHVADIYLHIRYEKLIKTPS